MSTVTPHTKTEKQLVPQLRFSEFSGEWEFSLLKNYIKDVSSGWSPKCLSEPAQKGEWGSLKTTSISWSGYNPLENKKLPDSLIAREGIEVVKDDILITRVGPKERVGVVVHVNLDHEKLMVSDNMFRLKLKDNVIPNFIPLILGSNKVQKDWKRKIAGLASAQVVINQKILRKTKINLPTLPEQQKIASFLTAVDTKLQQLTKKKELLAQYKKGVMQQLFSQQLRFKQEDGSDYPDWEEKVFKDYVIDYRLGGNYSNSEEVTEYPLIKMGNLGRGKINLIKIQYIVKSESIDAKDKIEYNDLFFNTRNTLELVGKVAIWKNELPNAYYNSNLMLLKFENNEFMNYRLNSYEGIKGLKRFATGTTSVAAIYTKDLLKLKLMIPSIEEQQKIANYLSALDAKIESVGQQIEKTQAFKKGLLQQMFV